MWWSRYARLARDPDLARQVFEEAARQQQALIPKLEAERKRLQREKQHKGEEIRRLVATIAAADMPSPSVTERLAELEAISTKIGQRLTDIDAELAALEQNRVDPEAVAAALNEFDQMWEVMWPAEQVRILQLVADRVEIRGSGGSGIDISLHLQPLAGPVPPHPAPDRDQEPLVICLAQCRLR